MAAVVIERLLKVAVPPVIVWVVVPERVALPGLVAIASVTCVVLSLVTRLP